MDQFFADFGQPTWLPFPVIVARLMLATVLGALIGLEREWRNQSAGLRTHILVCVSAATAAVLTIETIHAPFMQDDSIRIDPIRLIEAVTAGVAFLAAGLIVVARGQVRGLTTGAGMWLAGSVGLACGLGYWQIALMAALIAVLVLALLRVFERSLALKDEDGRLPPKDRGE
jgi:putative Mg2+ transporter-C (MgtC) family protein